MSCFFISELIRILGCQTSRCIVFNTDMDIFNVVDKANLAQILENNLLVQKLIFLFPSCSKNKCKLALSCFDPVHYCMGDGPIQTHDIYYLVSLLRP